ncbi:MAG: hypothetical protein RLZZ217_810, partial [Planctomycetota bacterium]
MRAGAVPQVQWIPLREAECVDAGATGA